MSKDFECLPLGTGAELARLNDLVQELQARLDTVLFVAFCQDLAEEFRERINQ